ncbi:hypothetical protein [Chryseobacterium arthrosphaerae]|uniref:hypothetical protein n=1 Tax=Chryseobacterium arthrosphaerae TaxID=651561 RepID=UPI001E46A538|nr:hypothetical protein [Chryseobacterium arthrosphaerae]UEQ76093.1 hypothetical protein J8N07_21090 [Chryseobacterium arthrosphaerae]WES97432.1 hypothetical protein P2W68_21795 [Chryseobacterium arthrosphaerae]
MKKKITLVFSLMATTIAFGQVGINTTTPQATLDVVGKKGATDKDGFIAPRLTRAELTAKGDALYGASQNGAIIFITDITGGNSNTQRVNITQTGYYYFDSTANLWQKIPNKNEVTALEPWQVVNSTTKATLNTQNIYQNANVGVGDFSATSIDSKLKITGGNSSALGIEESNVGTYYNISVEPGGITFTQRRPSNRRQFLFKTDGSFQIGQSLLNSTATGENNTASFFYDGPTSRLAINTNSAATESIDTGGNIRIRNLSDGSNTTDYTRSVVAKTDGTLGYRTTVSPPTLTGVTKVSDSPLSTGVSFSNFIPVIIQNQKQGGDAASYVMYSSGGTNPTWLIDFTDSTNSSANVSYSIIFIPR